MKSPATAEDHYEMAKDLYNEKECDYFNNYLLAYSQKAFQNLTTLSPEASTNLGISSRCAA
jgi:hypothetical protein